MDAASRTIYLALLVIAMITMLRPACCGSVPGVAVNNTLRIGYLVPWSVGWNIGPFLGSAIIPAIEEVKNRQLLNDYEIDFIVKDSGCETLMGFRAGVAVWQESDDLDVIIGAGCSVVCQPIALLADAWNIPVISFSCASATLSDKELYPTFTRSVGTYVGLVPEFYAIIRAFGWDRVAVVTFTTEVYQKTAEAAKSYFEKQGMTVFYHALDMTVAGETVIPAALRAQQDLVRLVKSEAHIVLLTMYGLDVRNFLITCYEEGMLNGEYVFIVIDALYLQTQEFLIRPDLGADQLLVGVINTEPRTAAGPAYDEFAQDVIDAFSDPIFDGMDKLSPDASIDEVNAYAGYIYDAVVMWAYGANRSLSNGHAVDSGWNITQQLLNFSFESITGTVTINQDGDRLYDQAIDMMQPGGQLARIFNWRAAESDLVQVYSNLPPTEWTGLYWAPGVTQVPTGQPACGWDGEYCVETTGNLGTILGVSAVVFSVGALVICAVFAHRQHQRRLAIIQINSFFIEGEDLMPITQTESRGSFRNDTVVTECHSDFHSERYTDIQIGKKRAIFRNVVVDVKEYVGHSSGEHGTTLLRELMAIKDVSHENTNRFFGICIEPENVRIVMAHASRGSLQAMIADPETKLSWEIKISLATDIVRGMLHLQLSELGAHRRLTSENCVVDARWTCKVSDYGLASIREPKMVNNTDEDIWESLLWTAPEILAGGDRHRAGPKPCDVYSFGIIVYELIADKLPYGLASVSGAKEVVTRVRARATPAYRPQLSAGIYPSDWVDLAQLCWQDDPTLRPNFSAVLGHLRDINGGTLPRLVDSMVIRLEEHTRHLEDVVLERSQEVIQEKAKVETLLAELLPSSVATMLTSGQTVQPKTHSSITVFFSDIVGFTRVSAMSTPIQVVQMLNKLYMSFDEILSNYDVYKVATIGDAYMVVSGLPIPNGDEHANQIAKSSLSLMNSIQDFTIPHIEGETLRMRIGMHSGSCVAGVTGTKMPRYLLFGETIDAAAKIEAGGEPMRVHASEASVRLLNLDYFRIERHGPLSIKGLDPVITYWIEGIQNPR